MFFEKTAYLVCIVTCLIFTYISLRLLFDAIQMGHFDERSVDMPMWLLYAPMPISFVLVATEFGRYFLGFDRFYVDRTIGQDSV